MDMVKDCRINKERCFRLYGNKKICNQNSGRCVNIKIKNDSKKNKSKNEDIVQMLSKKINIIPDNQEIDNNSNENEEEYKNSFNYKVIKSIMYYWKINKDEFLDDIENIEEYIDEIFQKEFADYGIKDVDEMTKEEYNNWYKNYKKLRNYILQDVTNSVQKKSKKKIKIKKQPKKSVNIKNRIDIKYQLNNNNNSLVNCKKLDQNKCKPPDCIWVNKSRKYCRTSKNKKQN